ncbi:hypothetical protein FG167_00610 [Lacinutrix sp. WUR7]|uniref:hypothetical protein n=1 Tax=Lacinutrix sp. WUR7 TaxID=2653681 RepID=UPI00193DBD96|nr:hypothetical protein [Lacinutrix sp. WUR7]QRM87780.1 hypothetical protein FG167_00610 [Lacinutrix sp. WUR7]
MMLLFLKRIGFILLVFISVSTIVSFGSLWALRQSSFYKPSFLVNDITEKDFDYIVLGASTGLTTLNTTVIDSVIQTKGINLSMDDTALSSQYLMLEHFLAQGKTAKFCVLAPSATSFDAKDLDISDNDYRFLPYINETYVFQYFKQYASTRAKLISNSKWLPMLGVSYFNVEVFYPSLFTSIQSKKRNRFDANGNYTYPIKDNKHAVISEFKAFPVSFSNPYVAKIKALCMANNIELICYFSPIKGRKVITEISDFSIINHSDLLKNEAYFYDVLHVNTKGRQIASTHFANVFQTLLK